MNVTDDVEGPVVCPAVISEWLAFDGGSVDVLRRREDEDVPAAFTLEATKRAPQLLRLLPDHLRTELAYLRHAWADCRILGD